VLCPPACAVGAEDAEGLASEGLGLLAVVVGLLLVLLQALMIIAAAKVTIAKLIYSLFFTARNFKSYR
jgi:hypothetical protein